jgi:hypothetical protein
MKKTYFYFTAFILSSSLVFAQEQTPTNTLRPTKVESNYKFDYKTAYLLEEAELKACFKNGIIPTDLPKVSDTKSEDEYKIAIGYYINANPHLFVADEVKKYGYTLVEKPVLTEQELKDAKYKRTTPISDAELKEHEAKQQQQPKK